MVVTSAALAGLSACTSLVISSPVCVLCGNVPCHACCKIPGLLDELSGSQTGKDVD